MLKRSLGMLKESIRMSWSNIIHNKMRSFLTILGVIIGVMAIITLITVMQGATYEITNQFAALGTGRITVNASGTPLKRGLTEADIDDLSAIDNVSGVSPTITLTTNVLSDSAWEEEITVEGRNEVYFRRDPELVKRGRALNILDMENRNTVCLIDQKLMDKLFFAMDPLGETVYVKGMAFTVVGILSDAGDGDVMSQALGSSSDGKLIVPYTTAMHLSGLSLIHI